MKKNVYITINNMDLYLYFLLGYFYYYEKYYVFTKIEFLILFICPIIAPKIIDFIVPFKYNPENYICVYENELREYINIEDIYGGMDFMDCYKKDFIWLLYQKDDLNIKLFNDIIFKHTFFILIPFLMNFLIELEKINIPYKYFFSLCVLFCIAHYTSCFLHLLY